MMGYPEIQNWLFMSWLTPIMAPCIGGLLYYLQERDHKDYIASHSTPMKVYFALLAPATWYLTACLMYYGHKLHYNLLCEPASKFHKKDTGNYQCPSASVGFNNFFSWLACSNADDDDAFFQEYSSVVEEWEKEVAKMFWWYMIAKNWEFLDLLLPALANIEISYLNVFHHMTMAIFAWAGVKYAPGGSTIIWATINCGFLAIAYTYQALRRIFPTLVNDATWNIIRKSIGVLKIAHFFITGVHCVTVIHADCGYSKCPASVLLVFVTCLISASFYDSGGGGGDDNQAPANNNDGSDDDSSGGSSDDDNNEDKNNNDDDKNINVPTQNVESTEPSKLGNENPNDKGPSGPMQINTASLKTVPGTFHTSRYHHRYQNMSAYKTYDDMAACFT